MLVERNLSLNYSLCRKQRRQMNIILSIPLFWGLNYEISSLWSNHYRPKTDRETQFYVYQKSLWSDSYSFMILGAYFGSLLFYVNKGVN